jgi:hypothetical protein
LSSLAFRWFFPIIQFAMPAIQLENLTKRFGDLTAVDSLSLSVAEGEIFGLAVPKYCIMLAIETYVSCKRLRFPFIA